MAARGRQSPSIAASEIDRSHHPCDVRLDVVWHSETRTDDHVTFDFISCSEHWLHGGFSCVLPAFMAIVYHFAKRMFIRAAAASKEF
jgi:hypothetical protein